MIELSVNLDHVATLRNVRGEACPDLLQSAEMVYLAGAHGITLHLREDRRHVLDKDIKDVKSWNKLPLNFEMANTNKMIDIAIETNPDAICLVPEKRQELTTEGGLDIFGQEEKLIKSIIKLHNKTDSKISLFIEPSAKNINQAIKLKADCVELHTGKLLRLSGVELDDLYNTIKKVSSLAVDEGLICHAGHGINYIIAERLAKNKFISTFNIGHFIISESLFMGLEGAVKKMKKAILKGENQ